MPPKQTLEYTHGYHGSVLRSHANRGIENSAAYMEHLLVPNQRLLDVGSGVGTLTADFAERVGPSFVTALEVTQEAKTLTQARLAERGIAGVSCVVGDAHALPFADASFQIVHAHQVLQHVQDPVQVLREMKRVCTPGGYVVARDSDYGGFVWHPHLPALDHWMALYQRANRENGGHPNAGRYLLAWAQEAGFKDIVPSSSTWCYGTPETRAWWGGMWADRILESKISSQILDQKLATRQDLDAISKAWRCWAADPAGWFSLLHGEIICRV